MPTGGAAPWSAASAARTSRRWPGSRASASVGVRPSSHGVTLSAPTPTSTVNRPDRAGNGAHTTPTPAAPSAAAPA